MSTYTYRGDRITEPSLKGEIVHAVRNSAGKCIRGRNSNMLVVTDDGRKIVVLARQLRKLPQEPTTPDDGARGAADAKRTHSGSEAR